MQSSPWINSLSWISSRSCRLPQALLKRFCFPSFLAFEFGNVLSRCWCYCASVYWLLFLRLRFSWEKDLEWGNRRRPFGRFVAFDNVTNEANSYFKKSYSSGLFLAEIKESKETFTHFVLRLRMLCLFRFSPCCILYLLLVPVESLVMHCLCHSLVLRSGCCIFVNKTSVFTNESCIV